MRPTTLAIALLATVAALPASAADQRIPPPIAVVVGGECSSYYDTVAYLRNVGSVCMYNAPNGVS